MQYKDIVRMSDYDVMIALDEITESYDGLDAGQRRRLLGYHVVEGDKIDNRTSDNPVEFGPWFADDENDMFREQCLYRNHVGYTTGSGNAMSLLLHLWEVSRVDIPLLPEPVQLSACDHGGVMCKGSSGGCPGYAPRFDTMRKKEDTMIILTVHIDMVWSLQYARMMIPSWKNFLTYTDRLTSCYVVRLLRTAFDDRYILGLGSCAGKCKPCSVLAGDKCAKPDKRTYSMESTGIDCDRLHHMFYGEALPWSYRGSKMMQTYMSRYAAAFGPADDDLLDKFHNAVINDKSYSDVPDEPDVPYHSGIIPSGIYKGEPHYVYDVLESAVKKGMDDG